jgi:hypothetical protein
VVPPINIRGRITGSTITGTVWAGAEPGAQATAIDLDILTAGNVGATGEVAGVGGTIQWDNLEVTPEAGSPIWDAYVNDTGQLINLIDSSVTATDRWIPQITNGQRLNPGEQLVIAPRAGITGTQVIVTGSFVYV